MSYEAIRFCSNCNLKPEELENLQPPKSLKTCPNCKIAQYCDKNCQQQDYDARHKQICRITYYPIKKKATKIENVFQSKGINVSQVTLKVGPFEFLEARGRTDDCTMIKCFW